MSSPTRQLTNRNIEATLAAYVASVEVVGDSIAGLKGVQLLAALKRGVVGSGPYPNVAMFEAANRVMTDLVILHGVKWLLDHHAFPFPSYSVEYGHENNERHDIMAASGGRVLIGEAFNVAPSFFPIKKAASLKKLRQSSVRADYRLIVCNRDAIGNEYAPKPRPGEFFVCVDIDSGNASVVPNHGLQPAARGGILAARRG